MGEEFAQNAWEYECGIFALETERGDASECGLIGERKGGGWFHGFEDCGIGAEGQKFCAPPLEQAAVETK